ncbi:hypothetical protein GLYMA_09G201800v4 [Glycine max]|uniref:Uncharacterized protein n=1 Tax=Glycine max TaxID=3847 RepID=K7LF07_SOYBN|nr:hypothetical protein GYH30_025639 [Glycine max]KRH39496.1 hypothetical protein GLYMA_09G201800v4 [Glycine max]
MIISSRGERVLISLFAYKNKTLYSFVLRFCAKFVILDITTCLMILLNKYTSKQHKK